MLYLLLAVLVVAGDQFFKSWIVNHISLGGQMPVWPNIFHLTYIKNTGAAFSMFTGMRWVLIIVSIACTILLIFYLFRTKVGIVGKLGIAVVIGGAIGNMIDRIRLGYVVDMFEVEFMNYAVFNVADCFIVVGGILFCICYLVWSIKDEKRKKAMAKAEKERSIHKKAQFTEPVEADMFFQNDPQKDLKNDKKWTETEILESYEMERLLSEEENHDSDD